MPTQLIQNACLSGVMGGLMAGRFVGSITPTDYANIGSTARAISDEFVVENAALTVPMADGDNVQMYYVITAISMASLLNSGATSVLAGDYAGYGKQIAAASKEAIAKFI
jgi:hypothetical protein